LEKLGTVGDVVSGKTRRLAATMNSLTGTHSLSGMASETTVLSVAAGGLSMAMNALGKGVDYSNGQMAQFAAQLMSTGIYSVEACQAPTSILVENPELGLPDTLEAVA
jgi:hypothetical protein